jgi:hypothetical protein
MLFAFRIIMSQAILRLRKVQAARVAPARHGPRALGPAGVPLRARLAGRRPPRPAHRRVCGARPAQREAPPGHQGGGGR